MIKRLVCNLAPVWIYEVWIINVATINLRTRSEKYESVCHIDDAQITLSQFAVHRTMIFFDRVSMEIFFTFRKNIKRARTNIYFSRNNTALCRESRTCLHSRYSRMYDLIIRNRLELTRSTESIHAIYNIHFSQQFNSYPSFPRCENYSWKG